MSRYFDAVVTALTGRGIELVDVRRGEEDLDYSFAVAVASRAGGPLARYGEVRFWWRADEPDDVDDEPETGRGWFWVAYVSADDLCGYSEDLVLDCDAPSEVAAAVAAAVQGGST